MTTGMKIRYTGEDFDFHWGFINWKGKVILDVGADYGSTAECFLASGATKVICVDGDEGNYSCILGFVSDKKDKVIPHKKWICSPDNIAEILTNKVDIVKMDIEGAEIYFLRVPDNIIKSVKEYAIESHNHDLRDKIIEKLRNLNFEIVTIKPITDICTVIHAINKNQ